LGAAGGPCRSSWFNCLVSAVNMPVFGGYGFLMDWGNLLVHPATSLETGLAMVDGD